MIVNILNYRASPLTKGAKSFIIIISIFFWRRKMKIKLLICLLLSATLLLFGCKKEADEGDGNETPDSSTEGGGEENLGGESGGESGSESGNEGGEENTPTDEAEEMVSSVPPIDYLDTDLSEYLNFPAEKYKGLTFDLGLKKPTRDFAKFEITKLIYAYGNPTAVENGQELTEHTLGIGDAAYIYYRGYYLDENGNQVATSGMSNFSGASAYKLIIGSGNFISGFEYNLIGTSIENFAKFEKITTGTVSGDQVIYISYQRTMGNQSDSASFVRIDLTAGNADSVYGLGFTEAVLGKSIGQMLSFSAVHNGATIEYEVKVEFVTECEKGATLPVKVVECYFPNDYGVEELKNKTAYFEVYVQYADDYTVDELDDEMVRTILSRSTLTEEKLSEYEGENLPEKLESYILKGLLSDYETNKKTLLENAMWQAYLEGAEVIKYPEGNLAEIYNSYLADIKSQYTKNGGYFYTGYEVIACESFGEYAELYLGITKGQTWQDALLEVAKGLVKERLIIYYVLQREDLITSEEMLREKIEEMKNEYLNEYIRQYLEYYEKSEEDYTEEEFAALIESLANDLFSYYDTAYFKENACYGIFIEAVKNFVSAE